jgi:transaldolase / glucose-6-phosphate isomerase
MSQLRNQFSSLAETITTLLNNWQEEHKVKRLWSGDASLWTNNDERDWIGWLTVPISEMAEVNRINALADDIKQAGFTDIILLGMGGSSLCPDMMSKIFHNDGYPRLHILDSTDPLQIYHLEKSVDLNKTFFIVSSKSGSTLEPNILYQYFATRLQEVLGSTKIGAHFLAITDPGTQLETLAKQQHFRDIFFGVKSIGGRYSALSNFGMVPSGLMGINVKEFLIHAEEMLEACAPNVLAQENPGVILGVILGFYATQGKDKVTLITSPAIRSLGSWLEQLLAESTGKEGRGLIPIDQEPVGPASSYGKDRIFAYVRLEQDPDPDQDVAVSLLEQQGQVVVRLSCATKMQLGAEFFRWEIATAVAGSIIKINPFNQPNVESSKVRTKELMSLYEQHKEIPGPHLLFSGNGIELYTDKKNADAIKQKLTGKDKDSVKAYLRAHLNRLHAGDYLNISAFIARNEANTDLLQRSRLLIRDWKKVATCLGFGPRFLHSTGQAYKGGPNTGVFFKNYRRSSS